MASAGPQRNPALLLAALVAALAALALCPLRAQAQNSAQQRDELDPASLPARDAHQGLLIAVRADATAESSKAHFGQKMGGQKNPYAAGILGLDVYFRNDTDQPIRVKLNTIQLFVGAPGDKLQRLDQLSHDQATDLILSKSPKDPTVRYPVLIPIPPHLVPAHNKEWLQIDDLLRTAAMPTATIQPHSTTHGYFYFDFNHQFDLVPSTRLEVPDIVFPDTNQALLFFEIDLAPAAP